MALSAAQLAERKRKMQAILAQADGDKVRSVQGMLPTYEFGREVLSPQVVRPRADVGGRLQRWIQAALCATVGVKIPLTGVFDGATRAALVQFQRLAGIPTSGAVDDRTLRELEAAVGLPAPRSGSPAPPLDVTATQVARAKGGVDKAESDAHAPADSEVAPPERHSAEDKGGPNAYGEADAHELQRAKAERRPAPDPRVAAEQRFLHAERMQAVMALAFARDWIRDELSRLGRRGEPALLAELLAWWERGRGATPAPWMKEAAALAERDQAAAVARVREAWQRDHAAAAA